MAIFNETMGTLNDALDYSAKRNQLISNNIANVDTPNFKSKDTSFKTALARATDHLQAKRTNEKHIPFSLDMERFPTFTKTNTIYNHNGNNVDMDKEMSNLAKNEIYYRSVTEQMNNKLRMMKSAIKGGG